MTLAEKIITAAREYRKYGWNVLPLYNYSKNPASSTFIRKKGWKEFEERTLTESEFQAAFGEQNLTGVGFITGALSRTVVLDEDSYKEGGKKVEVVSPMVSQTASGGRHIFGKYGQPVKTIGYRKGVNVEVKSQGGFIVLPPSQVYKKGADGKVSEEIGEYTWLSHCEWEKLPYITQEDVDPFKGSSEGHRVKLREFVNAGVGDRHISLRTIALSLFNRFPQDEWDIAERNIRLEAAQQDPPPVENHIDAIIRDARDFVLNHPKDKYLPPKPVVEATPIINYNRMNEDEMEYVEHREVLTTGLRKIDAVLPFVAGFYIIVGNPGAGKGWFATWLAKQFFIMHQKRTVMFSLEMSEPLIRARLFQQWSGLTLEQFEDGGNTIPAKNLMRQDAIAIYPFGQNDTRYQTPENFAADIDRFYEEGYRIFMFDHFHEIDGANSEIGTNQRVTQIWGKVFQEVCKKYTDIWLLVFAQPNGAAAKKVLLERTDISGGKGLTQKCEVFISLNRTLLPMEKGFNVDAHKDQDRTITMWVDKNRLSPQQKVGCQIWLSKTGNFVDGMPDEDVLSDEYVIRSPLAATAPEQPSLLEQEEEKN